MRPVVLSVAGSDPSGGAGIQADLKTFHAHGAYGQAVPTLLTVQNTCGVREVIGVDGGLVRRQLEAIFEDMPPAALKTGALPDAACVRGIADALGGLDGGVPLVIDPVLVSSSGRPLAGAGVADALRERLMPRCALIAPNLAEAALLTGEAVDDLPGARRAAARLVELGARAALVTGGHLPDAPVDVLATAEGVRDLTGRRVVTQQTHGTGCAYTAAIACRLARGQPLVLAVQGAKRWLGRALASAPGLGTGHGPLDFFASGTE